MAAKKKVSRAEAQRLSAKAKDELRTLLKRNQAGTITRRELDTGLKELGQDLEKLMIWIHLCP